MIMSKVCFLLFLFVLLKDRRNGLLKLDNSLKVLEDGSLNNILDKYFC